MELFAGGQHRCWGRRVGCTSMPLPCVESAVVPPRRGSGLMMLVDRGGRELAGKKKRESRVGKRWAGRCGPVGLRNILLITDG
jgi:hypothetical protein